MLEAGGHPNSLTDIPGLAMLMLHQPSLDWDYKTVPQKTSALSMNNKVKCRFLLG